MLRLILYVGLAAALTAPAAAQSWPQSAFAAPKPRANAENPKQKKSSARRAATAPQGFNLFGSWMDDENDDDYASPSGVPQVLDGGPRPNIAPQSPSMVTYRSDHAPGTIVIDTAARRLFLVQSRSTALVYPVSVGREGFTWAGTEKITRMSNWPDWHPPAEMRERDPRLPLKMTGGVRNPLGAKALYLGNTLYRIHGTSDARSIGRASSSGCFRMHNRHVVDLARRVGVGTRVVVIRGSGATRTAQN